MLKSFKTELPVVFFKEQNKFVAYSPAIDLSTCGDTFEQAKQRFDEAAKLFFEEVIEMGTLDKVLQECGWQKASPPSPPWIPPAIINQTTESIDITFPN